MAVFQKLPKVLNPSPISIEGHLEDLRCYIHGKLSMYGTAGFKESVVQRIVREAQNNFLVSIVKFCVLCQAVLIQQWVRLAVEKLKLCYTQADVELVLQQLPAGIEAIYVRMASSIAQNASATDRALASMIFQSVTC